MKGKVVVILVVVLAVAGGLWYRFGRTQAPTDEVMASGTVEATDAQLGFQAAGRIVEVVPHEGDTVAAGAHLAALDQSEMKARRQQAAAAVAAAEAHLSELESGFRSEEVKQAKAALAAARDRLADAKRDLDRTTTLFHGGAVSQELYDKAVTGNDLASSQVDQAEEQLRLLNRGYRREQVAAARSQLQEAQAALAATDAVLANMTLEAPFAGLVSVRHREPGEVVSPGAPVLTLLNRDDRWVRIYVREDQVGQVHLGDAATIRADGLPDQTFEGRVSYVASQAEFTPKNVQTQEERVRLVYAVKVKIVGDESYALKPGMPADVTLQLNRAAAKQEG